MARKSTPRAAHGPVVATRGAPEPRFGHANVRSGAFGSGTRVPGDGSEVRRANLIPELRHLRVQRYKQEPRRRSSERDTDARVCTDFSKMLGWLQLCFSPELKYKPLQ